MPRITADTIPEHVARQEAAVVEAAVRLFLERGYPAVSLSDVASEVGLARSSLYRYVPDKAHLLVLWYRGAVERTIASWRQATTGEGPAIERVQAWADAYLGWAASPEHALVGPLQEALPELDEPTREEVGRRHREMMAVVADVVAEAGVPEAEVAGTVDLLANLVLGAARAESRGPDASVRPRLAAGIAAIVAPPPSPRRRPGAGRTPAARRV